MRATIYDVLGAAPSGGSALSVDQRNGASKIGSAVYVAEIVGPQIAGGGGFAEQTVTLTVYESNNTRFNVPWGWVFPSAFRASKNARQSALSKEDMHCQKKRKSATELHEEVVPLASTSRGPGGTALLGGWRDGWILVQVGSVVVVEPSVAVVVVVLLDVEVEVLLDVEVEVLVVVVLVVVVGQTSVTIPPPSTATAGMTQLVSTSLCGEPPSGHVPALVNAAPNLLCAFVMHDVSRGSPLVAAFE